MVVMALLLALPRGLYAQAETNQRFVKIVHSAQGTTAVDSLGGAWYYDSDQGVFVRGDGRAAGAESATSTADTTAVGGDEIILPPEIRCVDIHRGDITKLFEDVVVDVDERVEGTVFSGRDVIVKGLVTGDVVSMRAVVVEGTGEVRGNVVAKEIRRERGGRILGERSEVPFPAVSGWGLPAGFLVVPSMVTFFITGFLIFLCVIILALAPNPARRVVVRIDRGVVSAFFWGVLGWFSIVPVFALLIITIVGIPVAILVFPLVIVAAIALAFASVALYLGERVCSRIGRSGVSIYTKGICGVLAVEGLAIAANIFNMLGAAVVHHILTVIYIIVVLVAVTIGLGAVIATRFGSRPKRPETPAGTELSVRVALVSPPPLVPNPPSPPPPIPPPTDSFRATE